MSLFVDRKYIAIISNRLLLFKQKKNDLYTFRCPYCKDSKRNKVKTRGYLYVKGNDFFFKCFNCPESHTFSNFLKFLDPNLQKKYAMERFANGENKHSNFEKPKIDFFTDSKPKFASKTIKIPSLAELPTNHFCRQYIEQTRLIPSQFLKVLYFANDFEAFVEQMAPGKHNSLGHTPKLIIPFYNKEKKLFAFQARSLVTDDRYITIKLDDKEPKIYGMERCDPSKLIYILEGPLDSLFLPNAIAAAGSDLPTVGTNNCVFVFDNEPRSKEINQKMRQIIDKGYNICIWPEYTRAYGKDINEIIQSGVYGPEEVKRIIDNSTHEGLEAEMQFAKWSKV